MLVTTDQVRETKYKKKVSFTLPADILTPQFRHLPLIDRLSSDKELDLR